MSHESPSEHAPTRTSQHGSLGPKLANLDESCLVRPSTDPHAAAVTALLVADYLGQPEIVGKLTSAGISSESVTELKQIARAIIREVTDLGGDYLSDAKGIPGELISRGEAVRSAITAALEKVLFADRDVQQWLEAIRLGNGVVDLVYDLRTLGDLCTLHGNASAASTVTANAVHSALAAADAIEFALRTDETPSQALGRGTMARLWTLFLPAYEHAAIAGRLLTKGEGRERQFPPLALVASHRRARRRPLSVVPPGMTPSLIPLRRMGTPPRPSGSPSSATVPLAGMTSRPPELEDFDLLHLETTESVEIVRSEPPPGRGPSKAPSVPPSPPTDADRESWSDTRIRKRQTLELEVGIGSESNFYQGFTENLSAGGVFIATYAAKPIGAQVEVEMALPNGDQLKVPGVVRWLREATADGWPGIGVQFESLSTEDETKIRSFLSLRDPLFYED